MIESFDEYEPAPDAAREGAAAGIDAGAHAGIAAGVDEGAHAGTAAGIDAAPAGRMRLRNLTLRNFRNYSEYRLEDIDDLTIFVGRNGVGKTNILESIALMTSTKSFRNAQIGQLIAESGESARIEADLSDGNRLISGELMLEPGKRRYRMNGKPRKTSDVRGVLPSVAFTPDHLDLVKGSSSKKRDAFDDLGIQLTGNYYIVRRDYEKVVRYKNRLLKDEAPVPLVESINETLITCGSQLFCYRVALVSRLLPLLAQNYAAIIGGEGEMFSARYRASWHHLAGEGEVSIGDGEVLVPRDQVKEDLARALSEYGPEEIARKRSLVGPHNDKVEFMLDGRDVSSFASQGQQRSIVLAWKLAEVELIRQMVGIDPVLLLDDVMSELDSLRRDMLVRFVTDDIQTFVTATDLSGFNQDLLSRARIVEL